MTGSAPTRRAPHALLAAELHRLEERLLPRDAAVKAMLRTAASAMLLAIERASAASGDATRQRTAWARCAQSESAVRVGLREMRRRRRIDVAEHGHLLDLLDEACRFRNHAFLAAAATLPHPRAQPPPVAAAPPPPRQHPPSSPAPAVTLS